MAWHEPSDPNQLDKCTKVTVKFQYKDQTILNIIVHVSTVHIQIQDHVGIFRKWGNNKLPELTNSINNNVNGVIAEHHCLYKRSNTRNQGNPPQSNQAH